MDLYSKDLKQQKLDELKNIFPEIFEDKTINYKKLKTILDDTIEESKAEHYSFNWFGKKINNDIISHMPRDAKLICCEKSLDDSVKLNLHTNLDLETL